MQTIDSLQRTIGIITELQSVVRTMKTLSAVSIRQYERALISLEDYIRTIEMGLWVVLPPSSHRAARQRARAGEKIGAVIFGSDHGLCGKFNEDVGAYAIDKMNGFQIRHEDRIILAVGSRAAAWITDNGHSVDATISEPASALTISKTVQKIVTVVDDWQQSKHITRIVLFYNRYNKNKTRTASMLPLLPIDTERFRALKEHPWPSRVLPAYTMDQTQLFKTLVHQYLFSLIFRACAESLASEHSSRLVSMQSAEKSITEHLQELGTRYHQYRQDAITAELLDIVAGFKTITAAVNAD